MESTKQKFQPNPRDNTNFLSTIFFIWIIPFFKKGYTKVLQMDDMFRPLKCDHSDLLGDRLEQKWRDQLQTKTGRPSLIKAVALTFWREYTVFSCMCLFSDIVFRLTQPLLLGQLLRYFREDPEISREQALWCAGGILTIIGLNTILLNQIYITAFHIGMKIRVAICSVVYRKSLRLSQTALGETASGKMVNLLSNDVNRFDLVSAFVNSMWTAPLLTVCIAVLLFREIGYPAFIGIAIVFIVVPLQSYTGKLSSKFRLQTALRTDERVRFMDEIISGVQVIKMYAWEKPFSNLITHVRKMELNIVRKSAYVRGLFMTFILFTTRMAIFCTMLSIALLYGADQITAAKVFVMSSYFGVISYTMSQMFVRGVAEIAETLVAFKRLQNFLLLDEKKMDRIEDNKEREQNGMTSNNVEMSEKSIRINDLAAKNLSVSIKNATARWTMPKKSDQMNSSKSHKVTQVDDENAWKLPTLNDINVEFPKGKLIGVIGPVGSGKSSFLQALLRELPFESGSLSINGSISYACQEPWIFAASVRQNILFGADFNRKRYDAVVETCALTKDFEQFENGDRTIVGDRGASLSGGQKARINLARACYRNVDIYLLDDPLSAVDAHVGTHIFNKCIGPTSRLAQLKATRILVTHQVHFLKEADWLVILKEGEIEAQGTPANLSRSGVDFAELIGNDELTENEVSSERRMSRQLSKQISVISIPSMSISSFGSSETLNREELIDESTQGIGMEESSEGKVKGSVAVKYFCAGGNWFWIFTILLSLGLSQLLASAADYWVSVWAGQEEMRQSLHQKSLLKLNASLVVTSNFVNELVEDPPPPYSFTLSTEQCMIIHGTILALLFTVALSRSLGFFEMTVRASQKLHNAMFNGLILASMRFFDTNPSGRILNRCSKDIGAMDEFLPKAILDSSQSILVIFGAIIVATTVNPYFLIPVAVIGIIFIFVSKVYLKTSMNVKRLEGIAKSPIYTHLSATLRGLLTIRSYKAEKILEIEFDRHQDTHSACWFLFISSSTAFGFTLDVLSFIFIASIICYFMFIDESMPGEKVGLAITQAMTLLGLLQWGIRQGAEVSNQLMSVERIIEYCDLEPEKRPERPRQVPVDWPTKGKIQFRSLVYRYYEEGEPVLQNLSLTIQPKQKIGKFCTSLKRKGIVGRTGAGKSSLIGAIFRLACIEGEILIDDIDTGSVHLSDLRTRIAIIPQDPVLFSGTLRRNLDPFEEYPDDEIWNALEKVELKEVASGPLGLHSSVTAHGSNYSIGQRQLLCLARAILRKNRILVLDEATANVDPQTDLVIQHTIREKFAECTVLTVAHRLNTIIDSDRVLVMDTGRAAEFDEPHNLLQNRWGIFYGMVKALGSQEFKRLCEIARNKFNAEHNDDIKVSRL